MRVLVVALLAAGCNGGGGGNELLVNLRTDYVPGIEFTSIRTEYEPDGDTMSRPAMAARGDDFLSAGRRIAEFTYVPRGEHGLQVLLFDASGAAVGGNRVRVRVRGTTGVTVLVARSCRTVTCPMPGGDPSRTACVGGRCVDPRCTEETPEYCDAPCAADSECPAGAGCAEARCIAMSCFLAPLPGACAPTEWCDPERGCTPLVPMDAGTDAGPPPDPVRVDDVEPLAGPGEAAVRDVAIDAAGAVFVTGSYSDTASLGTRTLPAAAGRDVFVARFDGADFGWAIAGGGPRDEDEGHSIAADATRDRVCIAGRFRGDASFGGGTLSSPGMPEAFVACYSKSAGTHEWSFPIAGPADDEAEGIAIDANGDIHVAASFDSTVQLTPSGPSASSNGAEDGLVVGITASQTHRYHFDFGDTSDDQAEGVAAGGDLVAVAAYISGRAAIMDGGEVLGGDGGGKNAILFATGLDGSYRWGRSLGSTNGDQITYDVAVDGAGNVYAVGLYEGTPDFGRGAVTDPGGRNAFLVSYDTGGGLRWVVTFGSAGMDSLDGVTVDDRGHVYVAGNFEGTVDVGGAMLSSAGGSDAVVASFTTDGVLRWARSFGGAGGDFAGALAARGGRIYAVGGFAGSVDFGTGPVVAAGASDGLLLLLSEP